jgi:hypothetical protein
MGTTDRAHKIDDRPQTGSGGISCQSGCYGSCPGLKADSGPPYLSVSCVITANNELRLLKYLHLSESYSITVLIGNPPCYEIIIGREGRGFIKLLQIPFSELANQLDNSLGALFRYPELWNDRSRRRIQARNLKLLLHDIEAHSKALEEQKLLALKAEEEAKLRIRLEYGELDTFNDRSA